VDRCARALANLSERPLGFLEWQIRAHPDRVRPLDGKLLDEIRAFLKGIDFE
jgi:hypothetical protein